MSVDFWGGLEGGRVYCFPPFSSFFVMIKK